MSKELISRSRAVGTSLAPKDDSAQIATRLLRHFDIGDRTLVLRKLMALRDGREPLELWADFDYTLSAKKNSVWEALRSALPAAGKAESDAERATNLAKERAGLLTPDEHIAWSQHELQRYAQYGLTEEAISRAVVTMNLRTGARKLFQFCAGADIDRYIVSTSVADAIELVVGLHSPHVRSNRLRMKDGVVIGWDETSLLHSGNKHVHAASILAGRPDRTGGWKIILGDNRHDADILPGDRVLRIRMLSKHGNTADYLQESFAPSSLSSGFDLVLRTESLMPVVDLLRWVVSARV